MSCSDEEEEDEMLKSGKPFELECLCLLGRGEDVWKGMGGGGKRLRMCRRGGIQGA